MSSSAVKMLTVLVSTISNPQLFLLKKNEQLLQPGQVLTTFSRTKPIGANPCERHLVDFHCFTRHEAFVT